MIVTTTGKQKRMTIWENGKKTEELGPVNN